MKRDPLKQRVTGAGNTAANKATAEERVASEGCSQPQPYTPAQAERWAEWERRQ